MDAPNVPAKIRPATRRRRAVQPLWSALDVVVRPLAPRPIAIACSGGADSQALMEAIAAWKHRCAFDSISVVTVDHRTQPSGRETCERVRGRALALGFDRAERLTLPGFGATDEGHLRDLRYRALERFCAEAKIGTLLMGHHADDVADGLLLSALGLTAAVRPMAMTSERPCGLVILRPFLDISRASLRAATTALGAPPSSIDVADSREQNHRARLGRLVRPTLQALQPKLTQTFIKRSRQP